MTKNKEIDLAIDGIHFKLKEEADFSFLSQFGKVFCVFDQNDSGNISFGVKNDAGKKFFIKVAGAQTVEAFCEPAEAVEILKQTAQIYTDLRNDLLINLVTSGEYKQLFYVVFDWAAGECLFDHWNFDYYRDHPEVPSPREKFATLSKAQKLAVAKQVLAFMVLVETKDYLAVDFYDGSLMYDFDHHSLTICDIDLFQQKPLVNDIGEDYWGPKRIKAPEEYELGAVIDAKTNVFTIGALFLNLFGKYPRETIKEMSRKNTFIPLTRKNWELSEKMYEIALHAVNPDRDQRFSSLFEFQTKWLENY